MIARLPTLPPTAVALRRALFMSVALGALSGCDYASRLPDAPATLGYELKGKKPPTVTGIEQIQGDAVVKIPPVRPRAVDTSEIYDVPLPPRVEAPQSGATEFAQSNRFEQRVAGGAPTFGAGAGGQVDQTFSVAGGGAAAGLDTRYAFESQNLPAPGSEAGYGASFDGAAELARPLDPALDQMQQVARTQQQQEDNSFFDRIEASLPRVGTVGTPPDLFGLNEVDAPQIGVNSEYVVDSGSQPVAFDTGGVSGGSLEGNYESIGIVGVDSPFPAFGEQVLPSAPLGGDLAAMEYTASASDFAAPSMEYSAADAAPIDYDVPMVQVDSGQPVTEFEYGVPAAPVMEYAAPAMEYSAPAMEYDVAAASPQIYPQLPEAFPTYTPAAPLMDAPLDGGVEVRGVSPLTIIHSRMSNGAILRVHPVVGAPLSISSMLSQRIAAEIGTPLMSGESVAAATIFNLRARAQQGSSQVDWSVLDGAGQTVASFSERMSGGWDSVTDSEVDRVARQIADRMRRDTVLRRATLTALSSIPDASFVPMSVVPRRAPRARTPIVSAPSPVTAAPQRVVNVPLTRRAPTLVPMPRRRPAAPVQQVVRSAPQAPQISRVQRPAPLAPAPQIAAPPRITQERIAAPQVRQAPAAPQLRPAPQNAAAAPPPSFDTLRRAAPEADGPRRVAFRGVTGAPGDGDQALAKEMARVLQESQIPLARGAQDPNAVTLKAQVDRQRVGNADRIKIVWQVLDASGVSVGEVVQENDVPAGTLDNAWQRDAYFATQGARDGVMELLRQAGALG